jgi:RNA polymerase sigma-70 factor (ECF subfamily)
VTLPESKTSENVPVVSATLDRTKSPSFDEDILLVDRFLAGDQSAFEQLYARYHDKVFAISRGVLLDQEEAADAVQEIFTLVLRNLARFDKRSRFSTWLFRVAVNRSIQQARRARFKYKHVELTEANDRVQPEEPEYADPKVHAAMVKLSPNDRALLVLFYWDELSLNEIAESLACNVNAAKTRLYRARERFRSFYEEVPDE